MTFNAIELSNDEGRPIFLYEFALGAAKWRYTSSDEDVILRGYKWSAVPISDDGVKITGEATTDGLTITAPSSITPVQMFNGTPPSTIFMLRIYHYHEGDADSVLAYVGEVLQVNQTEPGTATISCDTISASMQRDGLRLGWQRTCPYALYDPLTCQVPKPLHAIDTMIFEVSGNDVRLQGIDDMATGLLDGGFLEWTHPTRGIERRGIEQQVGNQCAIFGLADGLYYGLKVKAYPGCDRKVATCQTKFNNLDNFGGVPDMPGKSPFDGSPVF